MARAIFGIDRIDSGQIEIHGRAGADRQSRARRSATGMALLPEDRKQQGLVLLLSVADNIAMAAPDKLPSPPGLVPPVRRARVADRFIEALRIRTPSSRQRVVNLSGGNQQKVVLAKWLLTEADIFIFDEPTRGIDVGAKVEVYRLMNELLARGAAIVMISSELPEVLGMSDRILVMREGRIVAELDGATATQEAIMTLAAAARGGGGMSAPAELGEAESVVASPAAGRLPFRGIKLGTISQTLGPLASLIILSLLIWSQQDVFMTSGNWLNIARQASFNAILGIGHDLRHPHRRHRSVGRIDGRGQLRRRRPADLQSWLVDVAGRAGDDPRPAGSAAWSTD